MSEEASQAQDKPAGRKDDSGDHNEREYDQGLLHCIQRESRKVNFFEVVKCLMSRSWDIANCIATDSVWECLTIAIRTPLVAQLGVRDKPNWGGWRGNLTVVAIASTMFSWLLQDLSQYPSPTQ